MPEEVLEKETVSKELPPLVNPFCKSHAKPYTDLGENPGWQLSTVEVDEKTHVVTPVYESYDLVKLVNSSKDLCGLDYMKKLLATGQAKPEDFYDDGKAGIDTTVIPSTVHEAKALADAEAEKIAKIAKAAGVNADDELKQKDLELAVAAAVKKIYEAQQAHAEAKGDDK